MTAKEIASRLVENKRGLTPERVQKAQKLADRSKVNWADVLAAMTPEQRALVEG